MAEFGTDIVQNTTVTQIGGFSFEFVSGSTAALATDYIPVETGAPYRAVAFLRGTSVAAGNTCKVEVEWYTAAKASVSTDTVFAASVLPGTGTWYELAAIFNAPATAAFAVVVVTKVSEAGGAWTMYQDFAGIERHPDAFYAYLDADTNYVTGSIIGCDVERFDYGSWYDNGTFTATAKSDGVYSFTGGAYISDLGAGDHAYLLFSATSIGTFGQRSYAHAANDDLSLLINATMLMSRGDTITLKIGHDFGAARTISGDFAGTDFTFFSGFKVE